jgi:hypothetical protein
LVINYLAEINIPKTYAECAIRNKYKPGTMGHTCNPSYSGGRDQEDHSSEPAWANSLRDTISKGPSQKRAGGVAQGVGPEFKPPYRKINK